MFWSEVMPALYESKSDRSVEFDRNCPDFSIQATTAKFLAELDGDGPFPAQYRRSPGGSDRSADLGVHRLPQAETGPSPYYYRDMQEVFSNCKYFGSVRNHNQVLPVLRYGSKEHPTCLLNFDAHSDMMRIPSSTENIGNWVNFSLRDNPELKELYWVLPADFRDKPSLNGLFFGNAGRNCDNVFLNAPRDMTLYFNRENNVLMVDRPADYSAEKYRQVEFHKRTLAELPDFSGRRTAVSIDLDYFDNNGYDTGYRKWSRELFSVRWKDEEAFAGFVRTLKDRNIRPCITVISTSPEYVREGHMGRLTFFSRLVGESCSHQGASLAMD
jgi:hypothetical protein